MEFELQLPQVAGINYKRPIPTAQVLLHESLLTVYLN